MRSAWYSGNKGKGAMECMEGGGGEAGRGGGGGGWAWVVKEGIEGGMMIQREGGRECSRKLRVYGMGGGGGGGGGGGMGGEGGHRGGGREKW